MSRGAWHPVARADLVTALRAAGPGGPTLCEGWRTEHLAAHLVLREGSVLAAAGIVVPPLAGRTERKTQHLGDRSTTPRGWATLVERVAAGPPAWHPLRWAGDGPQLAEFFVHTEDVRRAPEDGAAEPRRLAPAHDEALWRTVAQGARLLLRRWPVPVVLRHPDGRSLRAGRTNGQGPGVVQVEGDPGELLLWVFDRPRVARVRLDGDPDALARVAGLRDAPGA